MKSSNDLVSTVMRHPKYQELLKRRGRMSMMFFAVTVLIYAGFILTLAFNPELFGRSITGMTMSIGIMTGTVVVFSAVVLVSGYVYFSNKVFDPLLEAIVKDVA